MAVASLLRSHGLLLLPRTLSRGFPARAPPIEQTTDHGRQSADGCQRSTATNTQVSDGSRRKTSRCVVLPYHTLLCVALHRVVPLAGKNAHTYTPCAHAATCLPIQHTFPTHALFTMHGMRFAPVLDRWMADPRCFRLSHCTTLARSRCMRRSHEPISNAADDAARLFVAVHAHTEHVCPICCEDLDISDRNFFPCKCGYQVCMWCWHRIRESESGLCPACRTPYGDDPHAFSAVDVDEVLKANKEKEAAAKRERDRERQKQSESSHSSDADAIAVLTNGKVGQMEVPKDRTVLANMRVIRRNLVYAVGLAPSISNEDTLRKPEYFGQYGRISKIVLNRSQVTGGGDARRASTSAYVTFVHKEDTLACILALDGFYFDGRNIRASYGTSKYCSAFIKNVRCNNPECTYLHEMGDIEDTFTKQEIQAGYVTSGRDVLARQQQIMAQQLASVSGNGTTPRRKSGGGGPSGTGRASSNPVFPPPTFDEPQKPQLALVPPPPSTSTGLGRSVTTGSGFPTMPSSSHPASHGMGPTSSASTVASAKLGRSSSVGANVTAPQVSVAPPTAPPAGIMARKVSTASMSSLPETVASTHVPPAGATAASVVAGVHSSKASSIGTPSLHSTLTQLTPLKRSSTAKTSAKSHAVSLNDNEGATKLAALRPSSKKNVIRNADANANASVSHQNANGTSNETKASIPNRPSSSIGGTVIASISVPIVPVAAAGRNASSVHTNGASVHTAAPDPKDGLGGLGGEVFTGPFKSNVKKPPIGNGPGNGGKKDKWNSISIGSDPVFPPASAPAGLWSGGGQAPGNPIGFSSGTTLPNRSGGTIGGVNSGSGSSALASMLGISLPGGSGPLRQSTGSWGGFPSSDPKPSPLTALNGTSVPVQGPLGSATARPGDAFIGGVTIGTPGPASASGVIGGGISNNKSDIALLQSLLPGVHITSGNPKQPGFGTIGNGSWKSASHPHQSGANSAVHPPDGIAGGQWNADQGSSIIGTIGQPAIDQRPREQRQSHGNIW